MATLRKRLQLDAAEREQPQDVEEVESEPEDENPPREEEEVIRDLGPLDSSDDEASNAGDLTTFESELPAGMRAAAPPTAEQLEFKNAAAQALKGRQKR